MNKRPALPPRAAAKQRYDSARANLLIMAVFTIVNVVLLLVGSDTFFLFSATIPYFAVAEGMLFQAFDADPMSSFLFFGIAALCVLAYLLFWFFSGKRPGFLIAATVLFALDTVYMLGLYLWADLLADSIIDVVFHALVLGYLILGIVNGFKLKKLPPDPLPEMPAAPEANDDPPQE